MKKEVFRDGLVVDIGVEDLRRWFCEEAIDRIVWEEVFGEGISVDLVENLREIGISFTVDKWRPRFFSGDGKVFDDFRPGLWRPNCDELSRFFSTSILFNILSQGSYFPCSLTQVNSRDVCWRKDTIHLSWEVSLTTIV